MSTEQPVQSGLELTAPLSVSLTWNDEVFETILPLRRKTRIIRTRCDHPGRRAEYEVKGWPPEQILEREFTIRLIGQDHTLLLITNAPDAAYGHPKRIYTPTRDIGTYRDAWLFWGKYEVPAFVSVRITHPRYHERALDLRKPKPPQELERLAVAERTLQSGLLVTGGELPPQMNPDEKALANLLMAYKNPDCGKVFSLAEIGRQIHCSDETVRRRMHALEDKYPQLKRVFAAVRTARRKGVHPDVIFRPG
ncbi:MAG TPA: AsnC family protein [Kiritimatiellia bacterium]|nr:AsnC family protein [Kiritimatiellia bacterium]HSA17494.1 AsnC family protein [Kiritimatiellia bacterium]